MKGRTIGLVMVLAVVAVLAIVLPVWATATKVPFEGQMILTGLDDPGTCRHADHMEICRDLTVVFEVDVDDARFSGPTETVINSNFHMAPYHGQQWGTFQQVNDGGSWSGTWTGVKNADGSTYLQGVAHGYGGYKGLQLHLSAERLSGNMFDPLDCSGYILDPNSN